MPNHPIHELDVMWTREENFRKKKALHGSGKARRRSQSPFGRDF